MPKQINERTGGEGKRREKKLRPKKKKRKMTKLKREKTGRVRRKKKQIFSLILNI